MKKTLAQFVQQKRDDLGLSPKGLAMKSGLELPLIEDIEAGKELFLSVTVRQNLAKGLKCHPEEIRRLEKDFRNDFVSLQVIESLKELILNGAGGLRCPKCDAPLITKLEKMYDLEDNLVLHPKAHCSKCVFQIH
ncbi:helix-turn-helix domain-containing protein [bacterium]|nr:helix-turn-helix domain-containing protein [bacterium]